MSLNSGNGMHIHDSRRLTVPSSPESTISFTRAINGW